MIVATATPEQLSPATSAFVHHGLGIARRLADDGANVAIFDMDGNAFLVSDAAGYITGQAIGVNGGQNT